MTAFLISIGVVALAEIGDKTQLLALALAAKYRKPWPIIIGILLATLANHFLAGAVGTWLTHALGPAVMRWAPRPVVHRDGAVDAGARQARRCLSSCDAASACSARR